MKWFDNLRIAPAVIIGFGLALVATCCHQCFRLVHHVGNQKEIYRNRKNGFQRNAAANLQTLSEHRYCVNKHTITLTAQNLMVERR